MTNETTTTEPAIDPNRIPVGRLNGVDAEPGTLLGPDSTGRQMYVVVGRDDQGVTVGYATVPDMQAADARRADGDAPRSLAELRLWSGR